MIRYHARIIVHALRASRKPQMGFFDIARTTSRTSLFDLDFNLHMNNGKAMEALDLGKATFLSRMGIWKFCYDNKGGPVIRDIVVKYIRPLKWHEPYEVLTWMTHWDDKWIYIQQRIRKSQTGQTCFMAALKGGVYSPRGVIMPEDIQRAVYGKVEPRPVVPPDMPTLSVIRKEGIDDDVPDEDDIYPQTPSPLERK
eukprot:Rmarinus@m.17904